MVHQLGKDCGLFPWALLHWAYTDKMHGPNTFPAADLFNTMGEGKMQQDSRDWKKSRWNISLRWSQSSGNFLKFLSPGKASPNCGCTVHSRCSSRSHRVAADPIFPNSIRHGPNIPFQTSAPTSHSCRYVSLPVVASFVDWCPSHSHVVWHFCYILLRLVSHKTCMKFMRIHALIRATVKIFPSSIYPHLDMVQIWFKTIVTETCGVPQDAKKIRQFYIEHLWSHPIFGVHHFETSPGITPYFGWFCPRSWLVSPNVLVASSKSQCWRWLNVQFSQLFLRRTSATSHLYTLWLWLTVRHGSHGPNRNRWFT